jgi:CRP-like cAMP-binding protein
MDAIPHSPNHLLAALPTADFELLRPHLQAAQLVQEVVLVAAGEPLTHVFFPHSGVISLVVSLAAGQKIEVAMIGKDSVFGGSAALDGSISLANAIVQLPGAASTLEGAPADCRQRKYRFSHDAYSARAGALRTGSAIRRV